jgi:cytochrome c556
MTTTRRRTSTFLYITLGIVVAVPVTVLVAAEKSTKDFMHERHEHYEKLGEAFKAVRDQSRSSKPDVTKIKTAAKVVNDAAAEQDKWFPAGTGPETGVKTRAKAEIWTKAKDFDAAKKLLSDAAPKLLDAANSGDVGRVRTQFGEVGKACKNCHDTFRTPDED